MGFKKQNLFRLNINNIFYSSNQSIFFKKKVKTYNNLSIFSKQ